MAVKKPRTTAKSVGNSVKTESRTNIVLDDRLVARVKKLSNAKTTREAVQLALEHYLRSRDYSKVLKLYGSGGVADNYDPKAANPS